jgi:thiamine pyrophosphokinase
MSNEAATPQSSVLSPQSSLLRAVIVTGGPVGDDAFVRGHCAAAGLLIAADAGALVLERLGIVPVLRPGESVALHGTPGEYVSLLALTGEVTGVSGDGLLYPLPAVFRLGDNIGVSNELTASDATVSVGGGILLVIHARLRQASPS